MSRPVNICVIDDDDVYHFTFTKTVERSDIPKKIMIFSDGEEAINFMTDNLSNTESLPDIIFLDINMPIMDGWDFLEAYIPLKPRIGKEITIYMVSSSVDQADLNRAKSMSEISDYLIKPVDEGDLFQILQNISAN